jgi:hypothetical protein
MKPWSMPTASCRTLATGARQFVVHEALGLELVVVHAIDDRQVGAVGGGRHQDALRAGLEMGRSSLLRGEETGALQHDVDAQRLVRQLRRIALGSDLDRATADIDRVAGDLHFTVEAAVYRVEAEEVGIGLDRAEIVDRHDLDVLAAGFHDGAQYIAADAAEAIDCNTNSHLIPSVIAPAGAPLVRSLRP